MWCMAACPTSTHTTTTNEIIQKWTITKCEVYAHFFIYTALRVFTLEKGKNTVSLRQVKRKWWFISTTNIRWRLAFESESLIITLRAQSLFLFCFLIVNAVWPAVYTPSQDALWYPTLAAIQNNLLLILPHVIVSQQWEKKQHSNILMYIKIETITNTSQVRKKEILSPLYPFSSLYLKPQTFSLEISDLTLICWMDLWFMWEAGICFHSFFS